MEPTSALLTSVIICAVGLTSLADSNNGCTNLCVCKWKNGKQTAECAGHSLTVIPAGLHDGTQVIDISRNNFTKLPSRVFQHKRLFNLQKIFIAECNISEIAQDAFFQLSNLIELDLSSNMITAVPTVALRDCPILRKLLLAQNPIKEIKEGALAPVSHLTFLDLSNCEIESLRPGVFSGLKKLEFLKLDGNQLTVLGVDVVNSFTQLFGLHLHNNPWYCDCKLLDIRKWMIDRNIPLAVPPHCSDPHQVKGMTWDMMSLEDFACSPIILNSAFGENSVVTGQNATLFCQVDAIPKATIYWEVGGRHLGNVTISQEYGGKYHVDTDSSSGPIQISRLTVINSGESDNDVLICVAENKAGNTSVNYTLTVLALGPLDGSWSSAQIAFVLIGVFLAVAIVVAIICVLIFHPTTFTSSTKVNGVNVLKNLTSKKQDVVEMNDISNDKEEKESKAVDKQPRHETGSSGYGSDQLTPDLVSKIGDMNNGPSLSASTASCNHPESDNVIISEGYGPISEHWSLAKGRPPRYDDSPVRSHLYSEIYPNPCYGKDDDSNFCMTLSPSLNQNQIPDFHGDRYVPQNDRVRTLRGGYDCSGSSSLNEGIRDDMYIGSGSQNGSNTWKRSPLSVPSNVSHYTLPAKARFSPDEGYAEEALEGTEV